MRVTVLGAGSWGTSVASLLAGRHDTVLWARDEQLARSINRTNENTKYLPGISLPGSLRATSDLAEAAGHAQMLIVGVPTSAFRVTLEAAAASVEPWIPVVSLAKGLEQDTHLRMTEVIAQVLPGRPAAALTGPNIAREIVSGNAAASVIATPDLAVAQALQRILQRGLFRVYTNHDVIGCELGGALKNVIAIASGLAQGLYVGDNTRAAVMTRGLAELTRLGVAMGAQPETFAGLAGMGDLMVTCMSPHSRNRHVGEQLGLGRSVEEIVASMSMVAEGVRTVVVVHQLAEMYGIAMPVCESIYGVVTGAIRADEAYRGLREAGHEAQPG
ncbi:MAG: NAD(P)H-dependent glycerol-3-phosphate dehydrogenase [Acidimicrobiia bacterium]